MIELSEKTKKECLKYLGADGKFIINDEVPPELVETFKFFNDNNINVLDFKIEHESGDLSDEMEENETDFDEDSLLQDNEDVLDETDENIINDLNGFF